MMASRKTRFQRDGTRRDVEVDEALAAADDCECEEIEAYATSGHSEESVPYAGRAEGGVEIVESEWEGSEDFAVVVDAVMEHEAISGMVEVAIIKMKMESDSLLRRVQGMEVCNHVSMMKFDRRLQEVEAMHSAKKSSDGAGTAMSQSSMQKDIGRKGDIDGEGAESRSATTVEHAGGADRRAPWSGPSELTDGASQSMGRGGDTTRRRWRKKGKGSIVGANDWVEQAGGFGRRNRPTELTDGASRSMGRGGGTVRYRGVFLARARSCWEIKHEAGGAIK
jgi:hypothetical protein